MSTYVITYSGHDNYYGRVPFEPVFNSYRVALKRLIHIDKPTLPEYIHALFIEHRECAMPVEYCDCDGEDHDLI